MDEDRDDARRRPMRARRIAAAVACVLLLALIALWTQRRELAAGFIDRGLVRRGVRATYRVAAIGPATERLENLSVGDPARPDLTARWVEVDVAYGFTGPYVAGVVARGVRLSGRIVNGRLSLGELDKMLPAPSGAPFRLPDLDVDVADTRLTLDMPAGRAAIALVGKGKLSDGFRGRFAASVPRLAIAGCALDGLRAAGAIVVTDRSPRLDGPLAAQRVACAASEVDVLRPQLALDATFAEALDAWTGSAAFRVPRATVRQTVLTGTAGKLSFGGDNRLTSGAIRAAAAATSAPALRSSQISMEGGYTYAAGAHRLALKADIGAQNVVAGANALRPVTAALESAAGTPVGPLLRALADAVRRAGQGADVRAALVLNGSAARITRLDAASRSGARVAFSGGTGLIYAKGAVDVGGEFALSGGGFPDARFDLQRQGGTGALSGEGRIAAYGAGGSRLALAPIRVTAAADGGTRVETVATLDGPLGGGRVEGLVVPIRARVGHGGYALGETCTLVAFNALRIAGLALDAARLPLCPTGRAILWSDGSGARGGAETRALRLAGRLGRAPVRIAADRVRFGIAPAAFDGTNVAVRLAGNGGETRLDLAAISGRPLHGGIGGAFAGGAAQIANVPLLMSKAKGSWRLAGGDLAVDGGLAVVDAAPNPRFYPLASRDFHLRLADNRIAATGRLDNPATGTVVTQVDIAHDLGTGVGKAVLDVPGIAFTDTFQPERLTRLTTGVVALVHGSVAGRGEIDWSPQGTRSTGSFATDKMDLAANFGPVTGLSTRIDFTDLLGLETAPGQEARVAEIRTGVDVFDGIVRYQLLPGLKVRVESGRWPFAGGDLLLDDTILDFAQPSDKHLTFRLAGLDAARFIQQLEFTNISATGTFDGTIPMVFDDRGGRVVAGRLIARQDGGTLSYIGELTDKQLGTYGKLAFDALKSMRYDKLDISLDGALDGEFITKIDLDGIARNTGPQPGLVGAVINRLAALRFAFNIKAQGPFRALMATARSLEDPTDLIQSVLPEALKDQPVSTTVQPQESETMK